MSCPRQHPHGVQPEHFASLIGDDNITRSKGLGKIDPLSDEAILLILGNLSSVELATLSLVSKAFYCFSNHEELWKSLVLEEDKRWEYQGSWKNTYLKMIQPTNVPPESAKIKVQHFYSDLLYQPWLCATLDVDSAWLEVENIDRRHDLSLEEFKKEYEIPNIPVIITDVVTKWPAFGTWSRERLYKSFKGKDVIVGDAPMTFDAYLRYCDMHHDEIPLYLFDKEFCAKDPKLGDEYFVPEYFGEDRDLFSVLGNDRPDYKWLIYGPYKSGSTFHKDPNETCAWNAVVFGAKKWIMYPPERMPPGVRASADGADVACPVSLMEWMLSFYDLRSCEGYAPKECVLKEGEILFVPRGWWHMAINLTESCAITQNYVSLTNIGHVLKFLKSPHANVLVSGVTTEEEKITLHDRFIEALRNKRPEVWALIDQRKRKWEEEIKENAILKNCFVCSRTDNRQMTAAKSTNGSFSFSFM